MTLLGLAMDQVLASDGMGIRLYCWGFYHSAEWLARSSRLGGPPSAAAAFKREASNESMRC